jgi:hypothetical protein
MNDGDPSDLQEINSAFSEALAFLRLADHSFGLAVPKIKWLLERDRWRRCGFDTIEDFAERIDFAAEKQRKELVALFKKAGLSRPESLGAADRSASSKKRH